MLPHPSAPRLDVSQADDCTVARLAGCAELTECNADGVARQLLALADGLPGGHLLLDLGAIGYLTSTALGHLVGLSRRMRDRGGRLTVANASPPVRELFAITRLDRVLKLTPA